MKSGNLSVIPIDILVNAGYLYLSASYECYFEVSLGGLSVNNPGDFSVNHGALSVNPGEL